MNSSSDEEIAVAKVKILGNDFRIKCPSDKIAELTECARVVDVKVRHIIEGSHGISRENALVIAALNMVRELQRHERAKCKGCECLSAIYSNLRELKNKIESELQKD